MARIEEGIVLLEAPNDIFDIDKNQLIEIVEKYSQNLDWYNKYPSFWRTDVSDEADYLFDEMRKSFKKYYKDYQVTYSFGNEDYAHYLPLSIRYEVFKKLSLATDSDLTPTDLPMFKKFLETPAGQELEAWAWWEEYWKNRVKPED